MFQFRILSDCALRIAAALESIADSLRPMAELIQHELDTDRSLEEDSDGSPAV